MSVDRMFMVGVFFAFLLLLVVLSYIGWDRWGEQP
jgi:hypothetical protein